MHTLIRGEKMSSSKQVIDAMQGKFGTLCPVFRWPHHVKYRELRNPSIVVWSHPYRTEKQEEMPLSRVQSRCGSLIGTDTPLEYAILIRVPSSAHPGQEVTIALVFFLDETDLKYWSKLFNSKRQWNRLIKSTQKQQGVNHSYWGKPTWHVH